MVRKVESIVKKDLLALDCQLCFPLYACSKEIVRAYQPFLEPLHLTYTQYIVMMVLWEHKELNVKTLGSYLYLDSGTLTPLLRKLEAKGYLTRTRSDKDERTVIIRVTKEGQALHEVAQSIPLKMKDLLNISDEEFSTMYQLLYKILGHLVKK